jgi:uncharacterized protein (DUF427 family)
MPEMKLPGPDHPITVTASQKRYQVRYGDHVIADSRLALTLKEASYKEVLYFPRDDVAMAFMSRTERSTHCPYKGDASYYTIVMDGRIAEDAVWSYEAPYPAMDLIRGRLAFYPNQVDIYEVADDAAAPNVRDAILHTDDGAGASQKDHWPPTVAS